jgi:CRP-like cAMP-binding protein
MAMMASPEILRCFTLFGSLDYQVLKEVAMESKVIKVEEGEWLFYEGEKASHIYLIVEGSVELKISLDTKGATHTGLTSLIKGQIVGWSAVVEPHIYLLSAEAMEASQLVKIEGAHLLEIMADNPKAGFKMMAYFAKVIDERYRSVSVCLMSLIDDGRWQSVASRFALGYGNQKSDSIRMN